MTDANIPHSRPRTAPIIPEDHNAESTRDFYRLLATSLGFEDRRYTQLPVDVLERIHLLLTGENPDEYLSVVDYRVRILEEVNPEAAAWFRESKRKLDRYNMVKIVDELQSYTYDDLLTLLEESESKCT